MVAYRRNFIPGGSYFFTLTLLDRSSSLLVDRIEDLREAMRLERAERSFTMDAVVVLPDHLHCICTASGHCRRMMQIIPYAGERSNRVFQGAFRWVSP